MVSLPPRAEVEEAKQALMKCRADLCTAINLARGTMLEPRIRTALGLTDDALDHMNAILTSDPDEKQAARRPVTPLEVWAGVPDGNWTLADIIEKTGFSREDIDHALSVWFAPRVRRGEAGPRWSAERGAHVYPCLGLQAYAWARRNGEVLP